MSEEDAFFFFFDVVLMSVWTRLYKDNRDEKQNKKVWTFLTRNIYTLPLFIIQEA